VQIATDTRSLATNSATSSPGGAPIRSALTGGSRTATRGCLAPGPNGEESLWQDVIAMWPYALGIKLGKLGDVTPGTKLQERRPRRRAS
jgi:hypothetical protein